LKGKGIRKKLIFINGRVGKKGVYLTQIEKKGTEEKKETKGHELHALPPPKEYRRGGGFQSQNQKTKTIIN